MSEPMTVYCTGSAFPDIALLAAQHSDWHILSSDVASLLVTTPFGSLQINALHPEVGGKFGFIYGGTLTRIKRIPTPDIGRRASLLEAVRSTNMVLAVIADPRYGEAPDDRFPFVFELARHLDGVVFDGFTFLDQHGSVVLTLEGETKL